ncbi:CRM-domain containing factor CFM9, mitochondrial [Malania oleifera]|uniref:CRM-domain containing factor CFM9, mitochondrial n=1 Tax=Malania oleifera TaxID=397392 RepID=UPI0025ADF203|nr:CRM-domain containing factor CFM9, mitochondrial [Malania oleifera]
MFAARQLQRHCLKTLTSVIHSNPSKYALSLVASVESEIFVNFRNVALVRGFSPKIVPGHVTDLREDVRYSPSIKENFSGASRAMSTAARGRSMRSKVERRMRKESGKTLREIRRAKKLRKKLMTDEERLIYNLKRAKKKVALLLQKLKKYELPELPPPRHDPELLTPEQLQAFKKIGFRNKNYVPVGVRGVFGGVVQNMHLHWKFHETVQVCSDNFPKEKIKEMATMLARLSGGIVINIHNVKTIIMFRGRNYRQPKNLIPINTLTKRKALFKARFEQALDSQKLNIKKMEQQLRRMGVNPDDPIAMASIQRVASTFFNAIDKKDGSPYVFHGDKQSVLEPDDSIKLSEPSVDSDQEELDRYIAEIEDAADKEWAEEEAAEKEELGKMRYWNREDFNGRFRGSEIPRGEDSDEDAGRKRHWKDIHGGQRATDSDDEDGDSSEGENEWDSNVVGNVSDVESDDDSDGIHDKFKLSGMDRRLDKSGRSNGSFKRTVETKFRGEKTEEDSGSEDMLSDLENVMWKSDTEEEHDPRASRVMSSDYRSGSKMKKNEENAIDWVNDHDSDADESDEVHGEFKVSKIENGKKDRIGRMNDSDEGLIRKAEPKFRGKMTLVRSDSEDLFSDQEIAMWESDAEENSKIGRAASYDYSSSSEEENDHTQENGNTWNDKELKTASYDYSSSSEEENEYTKENGNTWNDKELKTPKQLDENWDSD